MLENLFGHEKSKLPNAAQLLAIAVSVPVFSFTNCLTRSEYNEQYLVQIFKYGIQIFFK